MRRGRNYPQILPTGWSKGLSYNNRLPLKAALQCTGFFYDGTCYAFDTEPRTYTKPSNYVIAWDGLHILAGDFIDWHVRWNFPPSDVDPFVTIELDNVFGDHYIQIFKVPQPNGFNVFPLPGFFLQTELAINATGKFSPYDFCPGSVYVIGQRYH